MKGFTLIETLVALTLLTVGLIPAFVQASSAVTLATTVKNSLIAANLAQEGVETVRALRDENWFAGRPFDTNLNVCATNCADQFLKLDPVSGLYQYTQGADSSFKRMVVIAPVSAAEVKVTSTVTWTERTTDKQFVVEEYLFDWIK
jgi:prepilin-type N-terminal cleavage/methylation domain-containing protein